MLARRCPKCLGSGRDIRGAGRPCNPCHGTGTLPEPEPPAAVPRTTDVVRAPGGKRPKPPKVRKPEPPARAVTKDPGTVRTEPPPYRGTFKGQVITVNVRFRKGSRVYDLPVPTPDGKTTGIMGIYETRTVVAWRWTGTEWAREGRWVAERDGQVSLVPTADRWPTRKGGDPCDTQGVKGRSYGRPGDGLPYGGR